jgi:hypothetical protein
MKKYKDNIIVLYSGGMGSFLTAYYLYNNGYNTILYFNDTKYESRELYRFLLDTVNYFHKGSRKYLEMREIVDSLPELYENEEKRKRMLDRLGATMSSEYGMFIYDTDGRGVWDVFDDASFIGNSLFDPCSRELKRERSKHFVYGLDENEWDIAIGIDWTEINRFKKAKPNWVPYNLISPLIDANLDKQEYEEQVLGLSGIKKSNQYKAGFSHDNCGGFCIKAGLKHFKNLLYSDRALYLWHEKKEEAANKRIGRHPFLRKSVDGKRYYITMEEYRIFLETGRLVVNGEVVIEKDGCLNEYEELDVGGCGCAI